MIYENDEIRKEHGRFSPRGLAATFLQVDKYHCRNIEDLAENAHMISEGVDFMPLCPHVYLPTCMFETVGVEIPADNRSYFLWSYPAKIYDYSGDMNILGAMVYNRRNRPDIFGHEELFGPCRLYNVILTKCDSEFFLYQFDRDPTARRKKKKKPRQSKVTIFDRSPFPAGV